MRTRLWLLAPLSIACSPSSTKGVTLVLTAARPSENDAVMQLPEPARPV